MDVWNKSNAFGKCSTWWDGLNIIKHNIKASGDSPAVPLVYPGPDRAAPGAVYRRTSPCRCRTGRARTGLPAAGTWAPAGWLWPPGPATQPARAPRSSSARGLVLPVAPWWGKRPYQALAQKYSQLVIILPVHWHVSCPLTATSFVSACSKYSCTMGVTVFSKSLSSSGGTTVSYTQFSCQHINYQTTLRYMWKGGRGVTMVLNYMR